MPTYSYRCTECDNAFDIVQAFTDDTLTVCPVCGGKLRKVFSPVGVSFTGSGFYRTDSRAAAAGASSGSDSGASSGGSDSGGSQSGGSSGSESSAPSGGGSSAPADKPKKESAKAKPAASTGTGSS